MSRPLVPRPVQGGSGLHTPHPPQKSRKISTACGACKQRKTRCTGGNPCDACASRNSPCIYDATSDQRRKIANQRNMQDLASAHSELEQYKQLVGGIIATIRAGTFEASDDLLRHIRANADLSTLAAFVRNECRSSQGVQHAFEAIDFLIDGNDGLPSPTQLLIQLPPRGSREPEQSPSGNTSGSDPEPAPSVGEQQTINHEDDSYGQRQT